MYYYYILNQQDSSNSDSEETYTSFTDGSLVSNPSEDEDLSSSEVVTTNYIDSNTLSEATSFLHSDLVSIFGLILLVWLFSQFGSWRRSI